MVDYLRVMQKCVVFKQCIKATSVESGFIFSSLVLREDKDFLYFFVFSPRLIRWLCAKDEIFC